MAARLSTEDSTLNAEDITKFMGESQASRAERVSLSRSLLDTKDDGNDDGNDAYIEMLDPYSPPNRGIFTSYLAVGFGLFFVLTPVTFYMVDDLDSSPAQQAVVLGLLGLPWAFKIFFGFITDSFPIRGQRRKPYYFIGWGIYVLSNVILAMLGEPDIAMIALFIFLMTMGFVQADVCTDAMVVERSKAYETESTRGVLQAMGYIIRFSGSIFGALLGAVLYNKSSWGWGFPIWAIFLINAAVPAACVIPFFYSLVEVAADVPANIRTQCASIWALVQRRAVWQPCTFIYLYNLLYLTNPAWNSFLVSGLGFSNFSLGLLTLAGAILSYLGIVIYKKYLFNTSWRHIYIGTTFVSAFFSCFQLILVLGWNKSIGMGTPAGELVFAIGAYGMVQFVISVQFLPAVRMFLAMCPVGAEGASYAMLTTLSNLGSTAAYSIAAALSQIWDVSNDTLEEGDFEGMWRLTLLCACVQIFPLVLLRLLPDGLDEQAKLQQSPDTSFAMGCVFIGVIAVSLSFTVGFTILTVV